MIEQLEKEEIDLISGGVEVSTTTGTEPIGIWEGTKKPWWWPYDKDS